MAGGSASRPDTLKQTDQLLISKTLLQTGRAIRFEKPLGRPRRPRDGAGEPKDGDSRVASKSGRPSAREGPLRSGASARRAGRRAASAPRHGAVGAGFNQARQLRLLRLRQLRLGPGRRAVAQARKARPDCSDEPSRAASADPCRTGSPRSSGRTLPAPGPRPASAAPRRRSSPCPPPLEAQTRSNPTA